jgi:eukaryotic-like serine/threonine-protein kinase
MATVYLARDRSTGEHVAVKVMRSASDSPVSRQRFRKEIAVLRRLDHRGILPVLADGESGDLPYFVMPYVEGVSLRQRLDAEGALSVSEAVRIAIGIAAALEHAHDAGIVHRDLKPENIMLHGDAVYVADFGIAFVEDDVRLTQVGLCLGTPQYMSPEQAAGDELLDSRSDVYTLAALLYEMLTGVPPLSGSSARIVIARILTVEPRRVSEVRVIPEELDATVMRGLAKDREERFGSAQAFAQALDRRASSPVALSVSMSATSRPALP